MALDANQEKICRERMPPLLLAARLVQCAGRMVAQPIPYSVDLAVKALSGPTAIIRVGGTTPVAISGDPDMPSTLLSAACVVIELAGPEHDLEGTVYELAAKLDIGADRHT